MKDLIKSYQELIDCENYRTYIEREPKAFLISCFLMNGEWQFNFYLNNKVTIFKNNCMELNDEMINSTGEVKRLDLENVNVKVEKAIEIAREELKLHNDETDKRIILLQNLEGRTIWNITLLTKHMNMMNIKVDAENGKIIGESFQSIFKMKK
jgi:uncharacterized membrane protein YkoI